MFCRDSGERSARALRHSHHTGSAVGLHPRSGKPQTEAIRPLMLEASPYLVHGLCWQPGARRPPQEWQ